MIHGGSDVTSKLASQALHKIGVGSAPDSRIADVTVMNERQTFTRDGEKEPGFTSAVVPTLEEKMVSEHRPPGSKALGTPILEDPEIEKSEREGTAPETARLDNGQLFGAPADASKDAKTDDEPPHAKGAKDDADAEEKKAPRARSILRKHLMADLGQSPWTLPTPTPKVDPDGFADPVCDEFWKDVWVASAVHNVSRCLLKSMLARKELTEMFCHRRRSSVVCSIAFRTTWSRPGSSILSLLPTMNA